MTIIQFKGVPADLFDDDDPRLVYSGSWSHNNVSGVTFSTSDALSKTVSNTVMLTFSGA